MNQAARRGEVKNFTLKEFESAKSIAGNLEISVSKHKTQDKGKATVEVKGEHIHLYQRWRDVLKKVTGVTAETNFLPVIGKSGIKVKPLYLFVSEAEM